MAYVPVAFMLAGMAAYTVLAGADFGAGLWSLLAVGRPGEPSASRLRDQARHAMGPVWEANHVWLIFVLVVCWTAYPVAFASIASTLAVPLLLAGIGIIFRGAAYALRGQGTSRAAESLFAVSSVLTPFALGTAVGAVATGRVPVGNALGCEVTSWLNPPSVLIGALAVVFSGYLAAVYLAADSVRYGQRDLAGAFRRRALLAGLVSGALALAGLLVMRGSGLDLTHGAALALVCVSAAAGLATLALCWRSRFSLARLTAGLAVAAVVIGWAAAQSPRFLPGLTVPQAAAGRSTLVALIVSVTFGSVILIPSLVLLYTLFLHGRLDTPESHAPDEAPSEADGARKPTEHAEDAADAEHGEHGEHTEDGEHAQDAEGGEHAQDAEEREQSPRHARARGAVAVAGLMAGTVLLVFTDATWTHALGVAGLLVCAVAIFTLTATPSER